MTLDDRIAALRSTSLSDIESYRRVCAAAASDDAVFAVFRSLPAYRQILEHVDEKLGAAYIEAIARLAPEMIDNVFVFARNDTCGSPERFEYPDVGLISPTTLRYMHVAAQVRTWFWSNWHVRGRGRRFIEVGGGYGGQARIMRHLGAEYTIVDLPEPCALAKRYLGAFNIYDVDFVNAFDANASDQAADLFLSNYALTECAPAIVETYVRRYALNCEHGYITGNAQRALLEQLLVSKRPKFEAERPVPDEFADNFVCTW